MNLQSLIPLSASPLSTPNREYEVKFCEMSTILSPSSSQLLTCLLNELTIKLEDVDLNSDEYVTYDEFLDVMGEFGATLDYNMNDNINEIDGYNGYAMIWNKLLMEQNDDIMHYQNHTDLLYIPFITKYMKPFITKAIQNITTNIQNNYDEILSLTLKLINSDDNLSDFETPTIGAFASDSYININHNHASAANNKHIVIQKAIKELLKLSHSFPTITKRKQKRYETLTDHEIPLDLDENDENIDDYLDLINNFMTIPSYHTSPPLLKMRIRKRKKRKYKLVHDEDDDDEDSEDIKDYDEFEEIDVNEDRMNEVYNERKNKIFDKYIDRELTMKELMDAYKIAITSVDNECILRAISVFDAATNANAPIFMKVNKIKSYLKQRGLTPNEIDLAYKCSSAAFHKITALQLANNVSEKEEQSVSNTHHNQHMYTNNIVIPSSQSSHAATSPFMGRRNSNFISNELFYPTNSDKQQRRQTLTQSKSTQNHRIKSKTGKYKKKICYSKMTLICIAFLVFCICVAFAMAQLLTSRLYIAPCSKNMHDGIQCRMPLSIDDHDDDLLFVDNIDWNYWFTYDEYMMFQYISPLFSTKNWMRLLFCASFALIGLYLMYFMFNVLMNFSCTMERCGFAVIAFCYSLWCFCCLFICKTSRNRHNSDLESRSQSKETNAPITCLTDKIWNAWFKNVYFPSTHWFYSMILSQIVLITIQSLRLLYFGASNWIISNPKKSQISSKKPMFLFLFAVFIGAICIINGGLYLLVIFNYIDINNKRSIIWRERGFVCMLILDILCEFTFILSPYLLNIMDIKTSSISHLALFYCDSVIDWISNIVAICFLIWHLFDMIKLLEQQCSFNIFSVNYDDEEEHAKYLQSNKAPINDGTRRRASINTINSINRVRGSTLSKVSETESDYKHIQKKQTCIEEESDDLLLNAYHEPSVSFQTNTINEQQQNTLHSRIDDKSEAILALFDGDKYHENEVINDDDDDAAYEHMMNEAQVKPSAKMVRNKHKKTKRMFTCCRIIAVLFIFYGVVIICGISFKLNDSNHLCSHPNKEQITQQPNLLVWDQCEFVLHPLWFNYDDNLACECAKFKWILTQNEYMQLAQVASPQYVLQSVLNDFKMLQIVYIEWFAPLQNVSNISIGSTSSALKALYLSNVNLAQHRFNLPLLQVLDVKYSKWSYEAVNKSLVSSPYLRMLSLQKMNLYQVPESICSLSHLQVLDLSATFIELIPSCLISFATPLKSLNLLFNALSGMMHKELLNRKDMKLMIAPTQMIEGILDDDDDDELQLDGKRNKVYLQYNPICDHDENKNKSYCNESVMCSSHCLNILHSDNICDPFCNNQECNYDGTDCNNHDECKSAIAWFQTIDTNANGVIEQHEINQNAVQSIFNFETNSSQQLIYEFDSFVDFIWINNDINCSHIN